MSTKSLPPFAPFPEAAWIDHIVPEEWAACLDAWIYLTEAHLQFANLDFNRLSLQDSSLALFITSYMKEAAISFESISQKDVLRAKRLRKSVFFLSNRLLEAETPPSLLYWGFLANFSKAYGKKDTSAVISTVWKRSSKNLEASLQSEKQLLIQDLEEALNGDVNRLEANLKRLNHLLHTSPDISLFFITGSDFLDGLISCYKLMNPPLRKAIVTTTYLCFIGISEGVKPNFPFLFDQLYALNAAAEAHKAGPTNVNDSLVAELVTVTPILKQLQQRFENHNAISNRAKAAITALESFKKAGGAVRPKRLIRRKINKGKGVDTGDATPDESHGEIHIHKMSLISQVQDIFPDLGSGFIVKLLDEYNSDVEQVTAHLLEDSLPLHLKDIDRTESLPKQCQIPNDYAPDLVPRSTPPLLPTRKNVFDDDEFDRLALNPSLLHFGRHNTPSTADTLLSDRSTAPSKSAILAALAAFDADDDERDDTYDVEDVGGTVDAITNPEAESSLSLSDENEEILFKAWKGERRVFDRDAGTRRGERRVVLRGETGLSDEAIEGWATMLLRDPRRMRKLESKFSEFGGEQVLLGSTRWNAAAAGGSGTEDSDVDGGRGKFRGRGGRGGGRGGGGLGAGWMGGSASDGGRGGADRGRGGRGRGGNAAGPTGEKETEEARRRKEANKGRAANHNRKNQRGKKMARGGLPG